MSIKYVCDKCHDDIIGDRIRVYVKNVNNEMGSRFDLCEPCAIKFTLVQHINA
jgi:hypothetical protein